jgi:ATP-binding cassette subfamily B protein
MSDRIGVETARVLAPFLRSHWRGFMPAVVGLIAVSLLGLAKPWPLKFLIDDVLHVGQGETPPSVSFELIAAIAGAIVGIAALQALFNYVKEFFLSATSQRVAFSLRRALFEHTQRLSLTFHDRQRTGDMLTRMTSDVTKMQEVVTDKLLVAGLTSILQFGGMLAVMLVIDWRLGLVALAWAPLVLVTSTYFRRRIREEERRVRVREGDMASLAQETMSSIHVVKAFGRERHALEQFDEQTGEMLEASVSVARLEARFSGIVTVLTAAGLAAIVFYGAYRVAAGALTAGTLIVFIQYMRELQSPLNILSRLWASLARALVRAERIIEVLRERPTVSERAEARTAPRFRGEIRFEGVTFGYEPDRPVLRDLDLTIQPAEVVAVVGPTGAGKSTIASLLMRLHDPQAGVVMVDGRDIRDYTLDSYVDQIAVVLQESILFQATIRENIAYGRLNASSAEIEEAARAAYCEEFVRRLPDGFDTVVGERGTTLSGGERQRIAIARALIREAPILILDEPTTGLDAAAEAIVMQAVERLMEGRTTLMIAHKLSTIRRADRIYVLDGGRIVEAGTHDTLVASGGKYSQTFLSQSSGPSRQPASR